MQSSYGVNALALTAGLVFSCVPLTRAADTVIVTTNYYAGSGTTARALRASLIQARPWKDSDNRDGETRWNIEWNFELSENANGCRLRSLSTKTTITIILPKWNPPPSPPSNLVERWKKYSDALQRHEASHAQMAREAAVEIRKRVLALPESAPCQKWRESIQATANKVIAEFREKDTQFDKQTDHGRKDGAWF
jgi:predicted secreted Zn-dependent protease